MSTFRAQHISRTHTIRLGAPPDLVFPLFTPLGEKLWVAGWDPHILYPEHQTPQQGMVFLTHTSDEQSATIWTVEQFEPKQGWVVYLRVTPTSRLGRVTVHCQATAEGTTDATISYEFTALSEAGNAYLEQFTQAYYQSYIGSWATAINDYLAHGQAAGHEDWHAGGHHQSDVPTEGAD